MNAIRAYLAVAAIAIAGIAGAGVAEAKPAHPAKLVLKLCKPHDVTHTRYLGIRRIHHKLFRVYRVSVVHVDAHCHKSLVRVYKRYVPVMLHKKPVA